MTLKLCKNCKNFSENIEADPTCIHANATKFDDLIYGNHSQRTCIEMRQDETLCGKFGRLYSAKPGFISTNFE
jgi:hypothetical protein